MWTFWDHGALDDEGASAAGGAGPGDVEGAAGEDEVAALLGEQLVCLLRLGVQLSAVDAQSEDKRRTAVGRLAAFAAGSELPSPDAALALARSEELLTAEDFLDVYGGRPDLDLDEDRAWPPQRTVALAELG